MRLSVAIPVHNEEELVPELLRRVRAVLDEVPGTGHELLVVNDGSTDRTGELLDRHVSTVDGLVVVHLSRNFGHQAAISAAIDLVAGDAVVVMDGDLQDPPELIPEFLQAHLAGADVVYAIRATRDAPVVLRVAYRLFYRILQRVSKVRIPVDSGDFSLISRRVVLQLRDMPERHRFMRGLRAWVGFRQVGLPVARPARAAGTTKYSVLGLLRLAGDGLFAFSTWPIRAAMLIGLIGSAGTLAFALYAAIMRVVTGTVPPGFTAILLVTVFLAGVHLFFLGVIGEYVGRIYDEVKARPVYVIDRIERGMPRGG